MIVAVLATILLIPASAAADTSKTVYAVWNSEEDFLNKPNRPAAKYTTNELTTDNVSGFGYVYCYSDVVIKAQVTLLQEQKAIIDLGGNTLTATAKLMVNGNQSSGWHNPGSVTIKNGTLIHNSSQFLQPRPNSEIYLENLEIYENSTSNFIYDGASMRVLYVKGCNFYVTAKGTGAGLISLSPAFSGEGADTLYKNEEGDNSDYVRNIIFEESAFIDQREDPSVGHFILVRESSTADFIDISFLYGSSFNMLNDNFLGVQNPNAVVNVNIVKGARFESEELPVYTSEFEINYYDSVTVVDNRRLVFGKKTELYTGGERNPDNLELIFGKSGDEKYPYQLCQTLCDVTWIVESDHTEPLTITETGYADGLKISYAAPDGTYFSDENGKVFVERHEGWSKNKGDTEYTEFVTLTESAATFYAVFAQYPVYAVEYASEEKGDIISGITDSLITEAHLKSFRDGSYIYVYENVTWGSDTSIVIENKTLTFDLGGNTFNKDKVLQRNSGLFELDGANVTFKNGTLGSSMTGLANLYNGSTLTFDGVTVVYNNTPAITIYDGTVDLYNSVVEQRSTDSDVPFIVYTLEGDASVQFDECEINLAGPLSTVLPSGEAKGEAELTVNDCGTVYADTLFALRDSVASRIGEGSEFVLTLADTCVFAREIFDDCESNLEAEYEIEGECMFSARPESVGGEIVLPFGLKIVAIDGAEFGYTLGLDEITVKFNMELYVGFKANFYVPTSYPVTYAETYLGKTEASALVRETIDGVEYYVVTVWGVSASNTFDLINVRIGYTGEDGGEYASEIAYDPADYFTSLLEGEDPLNRKLAAAAVNYVSYMYEYAMAVKPENLKAILASDLYNASLRSDDELPDYSEGADLGNIGTAFESAQLYLSSDLSIRFNIKAGFNGILNVDGTAYDIVNGTFEGNTYIQLTVSAYTLFSGKIEFSGAASDGTAISGSYSINNYTALFGEGEGALSAMLDAFYAYCYEAFVYDNGGVLPPYVDHTPPLDAELG